eukprot:CAMPEP_0201501486 /NCGR_PEP_ID=MMETSP0151_2-20130828/83615_1 /ASSEMBLY_ACC=CAM_ASM_000257 /TAXON_ID=200890 /ORGANISM="Paramoeba atlantica, Strain 621/1 / CCAP 1560/9" /LENGTH=377 /DNA_ID=CAMNT_0047894993 /DNA_START=601 /DNA_END=1731 /DNA_ORIENTATION=-
MAPEMLKKKPYSFGVDVWSLGVVFYQLLLHRLPFSHREDDKLVERITDGRFDLPSKITPDLENAMHRYLDPNPKTRITVKEMMKHPFYSSVNWEEMQKKTLKSPYIPEGFPQLQDEEFYIDAQYDHLKKEVISEELQTIFATWDWPRQCIINHEEELSSIEEDLKILDDPSKLAEMGMPLLSSAKEEQTNSPSLRPGGGRVSPEKKSVKRVMEKKIKQSEFDSLLNIPNHDSYGLGKVLFSLGDLPEKETFRTMRGNCVRRVTPLIVLLFSGEYPSQLDQEYSNRKGTFLTLLGAPASSKKAPFYRQLGEVFELCVVTTNIASTTNLSGFLQTSDSFAELPAANSLSDYSLSVSLETLAKEREKGGEEEEEEEIEED